MSDEQVVQSVEDRSTKHQTFDQLKPENIPYKSAEEALGALKVTRPN